MYRVAVIGCGRIASAHASTYHVLEQTQLVAAAEPDEERRAAFQENYALETVYDDYRLMLADIQPDIVSICTWPPLHAEMTIAAAEAGVQAILCEKPMAVHLRDAEEMLATCETHGVKLVIGHQHRFDAQVLQAREWCAQGLIGEIRWILGYCGSKDLLSNGTHVVDLVRCLADDNPVAWVMGQLDRRTDYWEFGHPAEKMAIAHLQFENGIRGIIEQGDHAPPPYAFRIDGVDGFIAINDPVPLLGVTREGELEIPSVERRSSHRAEIEELVAWLDGGPEHRSDGHTALRTHEVLMAIMESSRRRALISLPLETKRSPLLTMIDEGDLPFETNA